MARFASLRARLRSSAGHRSCDGNWMNEPFLHQATVGHAMLQVRELERARPVYASRSHLRATETLKGRLAIPASGGPRHEVALHARGADAPDAAARRVGFCHLAVSVTDQRSAANQRSVRRHQRQAARR